MKDITAIYYTAEFIPKSFSVHVRQILHEATKDIPLIFIYQPKDTPRSHLQIYRNALSGAKSATTKYIALCEDDILYHKEHFEYRPKAGIFAYNMSVWSIYTWVKPPLFSYKDRRNLSQLICERDLFIEAMEERFAKYPDDSKTRIDIWSEPGKYESNLGVTERQSEKFNTDVPNIAFSHETALSFLNLGKRKKLGALRVTALPYWGTAEEIIKLYV